MMKKLKNYAPVGYNYQSILKTFFVLLGVCVFLSLLFFIRYNNAYWDLFVSSLNGQVLIEGAKMKSFTSLFRSVTLPYITLFVYSFALIFPFYNYHKTGSQSIYLMKRLPQKVEFRKRVITIPLILMGICLLTLVLIFLIYYVYYMLKTPDAALVPHQMKIFWNTIFGGFYA